MIKSSELHQPSIIFCPQETHFLRGTVTKHKEINKYIITKFCIFFNNWKV